MTRGKIIHESIDKNESEIIYMGLPFVIEATGPLVLAQLSSASGPVAVLNLEPLPSLSHSERIPNVVGVEVPNAAREVVRVKLRRVIADLIIQGTCGKRKRNLAFSSFMNRLKKLKDKGK